MTVQAVFLDEVYQVRSLRYVWSDDGTLLLALDCCDYRTHSRTLTFGELSKQLASLCRWQLRHNVVIGATNALAEVLTLYHAFECAPGQDSTLMLVSTPPNEYFEAA
jgi:hypothetical protein